MTWIRKRTGWLPRAPTEKNSSKTKESSIAPPIVATPVPAAPLVVPDQPAFSPASVAKVLGKSRGTVHHWLENGKLGYYRDNIQERYILRSELIRFIREYLTLSVAE